jgi:hypothetical protein
MGVTGVHPDAGLSTGDAEEAAVKRALHERAAETIVLASAEKLMAASPFLVTSLTEISRLVVPSKTPNGIVRALRAGGTKVERARISMHRSCIVGLVVALLLSLSARGEPSLGGSIAARASISIEQPNVLPTQAMLRTSAGLCPLVGEIAEGGWRASFGASANCAVI